ncbi:bifunctional 4-hydroxy-3-methylbut-2-enyl diphosphate reductase/30S ribosomal protein S1 [Zongyangia hominis]|uniref:4-hydroxy-3-methylbut-2-enyl diphosphate reductase n=1 Tax=Zongyangia hominis TaxID=2763677 RepID=A0A926IBD9_9FIRM|nr:bifunctional 4-hydroxy-3-methylbut-2-enyl diphosphate reductase/30S ribosomal protein S1 [Zongyangia hominis]MBC8570077.1 bifunctional 4-hydroxy-3-methylbut-2-enyl diphosphate reductase/30S ribosomal protein S1 [Zongyangia hominis]
MPITVAQTAGFCFGVKRAVDMVYEALDAGKQVCTLGPIIHNPQMVEELSQKGVRIAGRVEDAPRDATLIIRSHGVAGEVYEQIEKAGLGMADATCPFVAKIHQIVAEHSKEGAVILVAGDPEHPEVQGICGHCRGPVYVFKTPEKLQEIAENVPELCEKPVILVSQTTFNKKVWEKSVEMAKKVYTNLKIFDTICSATARRQEEAVSLAEKSDLMIVVGGRHSSNTLKLFDICSSICDTVLIETAKELYAYDFGGKIKVGVTAGASTPAFIIKEVQLTMSEILNNNNIEEDVNFEEALEQSLKSTYNGEKVTGIVTGIAPNEISVDIGTKHAGYVPLHELTDDPTAKPEDIVKKGDEINLIVVRVNDVEGTVMMSKRRYDAIAGFEKICEAAETGEILEGVVVEVVKGGVIATTGGVRVFIPASQATASRNDSLEDLLRKPVSFKILEVKPERRRAIGSIRAVLREQRKALEEKFWSEVEVGKVYHGAVKSLTSYGAFVDLGGVDGMVHISELSWSRIKHPSEVCNVGDVLEVYIKDIDAENKKISLGFKKAEDNPWEILKRDYPVGTVCKVKIVSMTAFGAFAQIIPGIDGLIHISQISNERINKPQDVLSIGQEVDVKITDIDFEKKRISLSMRALIEEQEVAAQEAAAQEDMQSMLEFAQQAAETEEPAPETAE